MSLSPADIVNVTYTLAPPAVPTGNFGSLLVVGSFAVIDTNERIRLYTSLSEVAIDFGTTAPEYSGAVAFFSQNPQPSTLYIGRWAQSATHGLLHGGALTVAQQALSNFTAITGSGSTQLTVDGVPHTIAALNFSAQTNLNGVASVLNTAISAFASCTWNPSFSRFEITSITTGTASSVAFGVATGSGQDVTTILGIATGEGGTAISGIAAESLITAVSLLATISNDWYGLAIVASAAVDADMLAVAAFVEASSPQRFLVGTTLETATVDPTSTTDLAYELSQLGYNHTAIQYDPNSRYSGISLFARQASVNFNANNTTITLMFKQEPGVTPLNLNETQAATAKAKNANVFVKYTNGAAIIQWGNVSSGQYIDTIVGMDWLQNASQTALFNLYYTSPTKIPQSDAGVNMELATVNQVMDQGVANGLIAPGIWTGPPIISPTGQVILATGQTLSTGYFGYAPPVSSQSAADRAARKSPPLQYAIKLGGAIHSADVLISVAA